MKAAGSGGSEFDVEGVVELMGWRQDGWASLRVEAQGASRPRRKRKVRSFDLPGILRHRGPIAHNNFAEKEKETENI